MMSILPWYQIQRVGVIPPSANVFNISAIISLNIMTMLGAYVVPYFSSDVVLHVFELLLDEHIS